MVPSSRLSGVIGGYVICRRAVYKPGRPLSSGKFGEPKAVLLAESGCIRSNRKKGADNMSLRVSDHFTPRRQRLWILREYETMSQSARFSLIGRQPLPPQSELTPQPPLSALLKKPVSGSAARRFTRCRRDGFVAGQPKRVVLASVPVLLFMVVLRQDRHGGLSLQRTISKVGQGFFNSLSSLGFYPTCSTIRRGYFILRPGIFLIRKAGRFANPGQAQGPVRLRANVVLLVIPAINADRGGRDCPESICGRG